MRVAIIAAFALAFLGVLAAFVILSLNGKDTGALVMFAGGAATSLVPQLITMLKAHNAEQGVKAMIPDMQEVKQRTNGPLTEIGDKVQEIVTRMDANDKEGKTP